MNISEVSQKFELTADTLRYYERVGLIPEIERSAGGIRSYTEEDCRWIAFIKCMRAAGIPIDTLTEYVKLFLQGDDTAPQRKALLIEERKKLAQHIEELNETLAKLDRKIANYEKNVLPCENELRRK